MQLIISSQVRLNTKNQELTIESYLVGLHALYVSTFDNPFKKTMPPKTGCVCDYLLFVALT